MAGLEVYVGGHDTALQRGLALAACKPGMGVMAFGQARHYPAHAAGLAREQHGEGISLYGGGYETTGGRGGMEGVEVGYSEASSRMNQLMMRGLGGQGGPGAARAGDVGGGQAGLSLSLHNATNHQGSGIAGTYVGSRGYYALNSNGRAGIFSPDASGRVGGIGISGCSSAPSLAATRTAATRNHGPPMSGNSTKSANSGNSTLNHFVSCNHLAHFAVPRQTRQLQAGSIEPHYGELQRCSRPTDKGRAAAAAAAAAASSPSACAQELLRSRFFSNEDSISLSSSSSSSLSASSASPSSLAISEHHSPLFSAFSVDPAYQTPLCAPPAQLPLSMAAPYEASDEELAKMQELSNNWEAESDVGFSFPMALHDADDQDPLVSERLPTANITAEYANADQVYVLKTQALPLKFSHYRKTKGDGNCGWRAVAFCYYELLLRQGSRQKFLEEEVRLKSLANLIKELGFEEILYEDFVEDTIILLRETARATDGGADLLVAFNDYSRSQSVITCIKLITTAWMHKYSDKYEPYLEMPVKEYCKNRIDPVNSEIENVGLSAVFDFLLSPAGIALTVQYLDRSPGAEATTYSWEPTDHHGLTIQNAPSVTLLYRPGHYDILYKPEDLPVVTQAPPAAINSEVTIAFNHDSTQHYHAKLPFPVNDYEIPGMSMFPSSNGGGSIWASYSPTFISIPSVSRAAAEPAVYQGLATDSMHSSYSIPIEPQQQTPAAVPHHAASTASNNMFRPSKFQYEQKYFQSLSENNICHTTVFKNSHFNTAHFNNPDFMPEQWSPDSEYSTGEKTRKRSSH